MLSLVASRSLAAVLARGLLPVVVAVSGLFFTAQACGEEYARGTPALGARYDAAGANVSFRVVSNHAERIDAYVYAQPFGAHEALVVPLAKADGSNVWSGTASVADLQDRGVTGTVYYGYRAWGPNWAFDADWTRGTDKGFGKDVDDDGNRFNPNKLLLDPYATEVSHDPRNPMNGDATVYASGPDHRLTDTGKVAPKGVVLKPDAGRVGQRPTRPLREEVIYEVHLKGFTKLAADVPESERGTYAGAGRKAAYLRRLGVTAVEFLPVQEFDNDRNGLDPGGDDYWGYATLGFFAPDRHYAADRTPGGPTREFKAMVKAFHDNGIKVYLDVVFNHTGEGGPYGGDPSTVNVLSWHGLDNRTYYELTRDNKFFYDNTGVNGNFNCADKVVRDLIVDSLTYWSRVMGVDGFRFDLAPLLGNTIDHQGDDGRGFNFDKMPAGNALNRAVKELPVRPAAGGPGVDLFAEPWAASGDGVQQQGNFPSGWAEWNDHFRDTFRKSQNKQGFEDVTPADLATRFAGSRDLFQDDGRKPWHSVNSLVQHDGPCLRDLYAFNNNGRRAWDQNGDAALQRQAARDGFALPLLSIGVPLFTGGDEFYRTQNGNDNPYNVDQPSNYLNWSDPDANKNHALFARRVLLFRKAHPSFRPADYLTGNDRNGNGLKDVTWYRDDAVEPDNAYWTARDRHFLAFRIDGTEAGDNVNSIYMAYNGWRDPVSITLPDPLPGKAWFRAGDTGAWMEREGNFRDVGKEDRLTGNAYRMDRRSILVLVEK